MMPESLSAPFAASGLKSPHVACGGIIDPLHKLWYLVATFVRAAATGGLVFAVLYDRGFDLLNFSAPVKE